MPEWLVTGGLGGTTAVAPGPGPGAGGPSYFGGRYFGGRYWGTRYWGTAAGVITPPPTPTPTASFEEALRTRLLSLDGLEDLTGVYKDTSPPYAEYPYLIFTPLFSTPEVNTSDSWWGEDRYQFDVFSQSSAEAKTLGLAALEGLTWDLAEPLLFAEGYEMARNPAGGRGLMTELSAGATGLPVHRYNFDLVFMIGRG